LPSHCSYPCLIATQTASSKPICSANREPSAQCVVAKESTCFIPATGNAATRRARATRLPYEPTRRTMNATIRAVLMSSRSNMSLFMLMSSPNHGACSAVSAWQ
jgi:hypothetical protein